MITRQEYISTKITSKEHGQAVHNAYYDQFVTQNILNMVERTIGKENILNSTDPHFNDIPLRKWELMINFLSVGSKMKELGDYLTIAGGVCILKAAARQIKNSLQS